MSGSCQAHPTSGGSVLGTAVGVAVTGGANADDAVSEAEGVDARGPRVGDDGARAVPVAADVGAGADDGWKVQWLAQRWIEFADREGSDALVADMLRSELFKFYANCGARCRHHMAGLIRATPPVGLRHTLSEVLGKRKSLFRMTGALKTVRVPTLVMLGQHDYLCRNSSRLMADTIPGAKFARIADAGHMSPLGEPRQFNATLLDFLCA